MAARTRTPRLFARAREYSRWIFVQRMKRKIEINWLKKKKKKRKRAKVRRTRHSRLVPFVSPLANPVSNEPLRRTGSYAAATITAALAIWAATSSSNVLQSLFLSLSYAVYRVLRGHRWLMVHRKQLYQRLPLPLVQHQSPALTSSRHRLLPHPLTTPPPVVGRPSSEKITGTYKTTCQNHPNNRGTVVTSECKHNSNNKFYRQPGTSWFLEQRRRRRRRLNALHPRRRRRRRRLKLRTNHRRPQQDVSALKRSTTVSGTCVSAAMYPPPPPPLPPLHPRHRYRRSPRHLSQCWCHLEQISSPKLTTSQPLTTTILGRMWSRTVTVSRHRQEGTIGAAMAENPWRATVVPPEADARVDS